MFSHPPPTSFLPPSVFLVWSSTDLLHYSPLKNWYYVCKNVQSPIWIKKHDPQCDSGTHRRGSIYIQTCVVQPNPTKSKIDLCIRTRVHWFTRRSSLDKSTWFSFRWVEKWVVVQHIRALFSSPQLCLTQWGEWLFTYSPKYQDEINDSHHHQSHPHPSNDSTQTYMPSFFISFYYIS